MPVLFGGASISLYPIRMIEERLHLRDGQPVSSSFFSGKKYPLGWGSGASDGKCFQPEMS